MKELALSNGIICKVDDNDYQDLIQFSWCPIKGKKTIYVARSQNHKTIYIHRQILGVTENFDIDHINGNGLDNRKENLRICTTRQNQQNRHHSKSSKYPGVSWNKYHQKFESKILINGKSKFLGFFKSEVAAALAYEKECEQLPGGI